MDSYLKLTHKTIICVVWTLFWGEMGGMYFVKSAIKSKIFSNWKKKKNSHSSLAYFSYICNLQLVFFIKLVSYIFLSVYFFTLLETAFKLEKYENKVK